MAIPNCQIKPSVSVLSLIMKKILFFLSLMLAGASVFSQSKKQTAYFPLAGHWKQQDPSAAGFDTAKLNAAIRFAIASETRNTRSMEESHQRSFAKEPFGEAVGPFRRALRGDRRRGPRGFQRRLRQGLPSRLRGSGQAVAGGGRSLVSR